MKSRKIVCFGEVLLRLAAPGYLRLTQAESFQAGFCGAEMNVAVSLARLGLPAALVTRLPSSDLGLAALEQVNRHQVDSTGVQIGGDRLGLYFLETGAGSRPGRVLYDRKFSSFAELKPGLINWEEQLKDAAWFHWSGISPAVSESVAAICKEAVQTARKMGLTVSADLNYRSLLWKNETEACRRLTDCIQHTNILVGNEEHFKKIWQLPTNDGNLTELALRFLVKFPGIQKLLFTSRRTISANHHWIGAALHNREQLLKATDYELVQIIDRVGGGDAFMAGLIFGLIQFPESDQLALNFAAAASCLKHSIYGDFNLATEQEIRNLMQGSSNGRMER